MSRFGPLATPTSVGPKRGVLGKIWADFGPPENPYVAPLWRVLAPHLGRFSNRRGPERLIYWPHKPDFGLAIADPLNSIVCGWGVDNFCIFVPAEVPNHLGIAFLELTTGPETTFGHSGGTEAHRRHPSARFSTTPPRNLLASGGPFGLATRVTPEYRGLRPRGRQLLL